MEGQPEIARARSAGEEWEDKELCEVCSAEFSRLNRRHHCRVCHRCVCGGCSPSSVQLDGHQGMQRVCTPCVNVTTKRPSIQAHRAALAEFGSQLHAVCGVRLRAETSLEGLDDALEFCRGALPPLQDLAARVRDLEYRMTWAERAAVALAEQLHGLSAAARARAPMPALGLAEAIEFCQQLAPPLREELAARALQRDRARGRAERAEAALAAERARGARLEELLAEAGVFCDGVAERLAAVRAGVDAEALASGGGCEAPQRPAGRCSPAGAVLAGEPLAAWQDDTDHCSICRAEFQMVSTTRRRHHCRICGRCVCTSCSPSSVQLRGYPVLERACNPCVGIAQRGPEMRAVAVQMARRLSALCALPAPEGSQLGSLPEALSFCESALGPLESLLGHGEAGAEASHDALGFVEARAEAVRLRRQLKDAGGHLAAAQRAAAWAAEAAAALRPRLEAPAPAAAPAEAAESRGPGAAAEGGEPEGPGRCAPSHSGSTPCWVDLGGTARERERERGALRSGEAEGGASGSPFGTDEGGGGAPAASARGREAEEGAARNPFGLEGDSRWVDCGADALATAVPCGTFHACVGEGPSAGLVGEGGAGNPFGPEGGSDDEGGAGNPFGADCDEPT